MKSLDAYYALEDGDGWWIHHLRGRGRADRRGPYSHRGDADRLVAELNRILREAEGAIAGKLGLAANP